MPAKELVEFVARSLVDDPDAVTVEVVREPEGTVLELHVAEDDMGKVIGRNGSVAKALRTLLKVTAARDGESVSLEILCRRTGSWSPSGGASTDCAAPSGSRS